MELFREVFNAARDGELYRLKKILDNKPKEVVSLLVSARTNNSTPLVEACANGHLDVAVYLIEECRADIEQVGKAFLEWGEVKGVTPLWCAAAFGHFNLVKCLVSHKASVNSTSEFNLTPLHVTCSEAGHFETVKYLIEHGADIEIACDLGETCLMVACMGQHYEISKYLVECGADVNRKSEDGSTALHLCIDYVNLDSLKMLVQNGATLISHPSGLTPLLTAAEYGHAETVDCLLQECYFTKQEKIDALELLGATVIVQNRSMDLALDCWIRAMELRYQDEDCLIEKPCSNQKMPPPLAAFLEATEVQTLTQLEDLILDPNEIETQALLVRERILGPESWNSIYYIISRGETHGNKGNFDRCVQLWVYILKAQPKDKYTYLLEILRWFSRRISEARPSVAGYQVISFPDILCAFERVLKEIERTMTPSKQLIYSPSIVGILFLALFLLGLMCRLQSRTNKREELELKKAAYRLVRISPEILHFACCKKFLSRGVFELQNSSSIQLEVVNLLLEVGASPNVLSSNRNTALHMAAMNKLCPEAVFNTLLSHGAHLDQRNRQKLTALQLAQHMPFLKVCSLRYLNLQCLSAKEVQRHKIPYKGLVHKKLEVFLDLH